MKSLLNDINSSSRNFSDSDKNNYPKDISEKSKERSNRETLLNSDNIIVHLDKFDIEYVKSKFKELFNLDIDEINESFEFDDGKYVISYEGLTQNLSNNEKILFNNLRTLNLLLNNKKGVDNKKALGNKEVAISLSASGGNAPIHFAHLQKMEEDNGVKKDNISIIGSSGGSLVAIMYALAKKYHPNLSAKEVYEQYYPKNLTNGVSDGKTKLENFKKAFSNIMNSGDFSLLKFSDLDIPITVTYKLGNDSDTVGIAGGNMLIEPYLIASVDVFDDIEVSGPTGILKDLYNHKYASPYKILEFLGISLSDIIVSDAVSELNYDLKLEENLIKIKALYSFGSWEKMKKFEIENRYNKAYGKMEYKKKYELRQIQKELENMKKKKIKSELENTLVIGKNLDEFPYDRFLEKYKARISEDVLRKCIEETGSHIELPGEKGLIYTYTYKNRIYLNSFEDGIILKQAFYQGDDEREIIIDLIASYIILRDKKKKNREPKL